MNNIKTKTLQILNEINQKLLPENIKLGVSILGVTGEYSEGIKEYSSETAMNNDIANIQEGEVVKVTENNIITFFIKETTMKKMIKEEDSPVSPEEYIENIQLADDILGAAKIENNELIVSGNIINTQLETNGVVNGTELEL